MRRSTCAALALCALLSSLACAAAAPITVPPSATDAPPGEVYAGVRNPTPEVNSSWTIVHVSPMPAIQLALVPGQQDVFMFLGRNKASGSEVPPGQSFPIKMAGLYDKANNIWRNITSISNVFCSAIVPTHEGKMVVVGGHGSVLQPNNVTDGKKHVRVYDYDADPQFLGVTASMSYVRWYPTPTLMADHTVVIHGGSLSTNENAPSAPEFEVWDPVDPEQEPLPAHPVEPEYLADVVHNFYPMNFVLPTGDLYNQLNNLVRFYKPDGSLRMAPGGGTYLDIPGFPADVKTQYPRSGTGVMLALRPEDGYSSAEVVVFGGAPADNTCIHGPPHSNKLVVRDSFRVKITWQVQGDGEPQYTFSDWVKEDMGIPRVGGDSTLLPNGDVVLVNGGQSGCAGGTIQGVRRNLYPAFWALLYQPDKPVGERYTILSATGIPRMYHGTAALTMSGTVLVAGCDACASSPTQFRPYMGSGSEWYERNAAGAYELRNEEFKPPYVFDEVNMPDIVQVGDNTDATAVVTATLAGELTISWTSKQAGTALVNVTAVSIVAPTATTHGFNNNQRVVFLEITEHSGVEGGDTGSLTVKLPSKPEVAPPQMYMLFVMNGKTYGRAWWVHIKDSTAARRRE